MSKVVLVIVFNHKYDKNIEPLRQLYRNRFKCIHFLVPFYKGTDEDVTAVYENSYFFEGYLAQGLKSYYSENFDHFFFIADDMILNPAIDENNYQDFFQLKECESFIPEVFSIHNFSNDNTLLFEHNLTLRKNFRKRFWWRTKDFYDYSPKRDGVEGYNDIPSFEEAEAVLAQHGFQIEPLTYWDIYGSYDPKLSKRIKARKVWHGIKNIRRLNKKYHLQYPLVASYSDIVIVDKESIKKFAQYCGVFAATKLFVEVAIPTALLLASKVVKTEALIEKRGVLYWNYSPTEIERYNKDMSYYNFELPKLISNFPADKLYIHPVKLSKWKQ